MNLRNAKHGSFKVLGDTSLKLFTAHIVDKGKRSTTTRNKAPPGEICGQRLNDLEPKVATSPPGPLAAGVSRFLNGGLISRAPRTTETPCPYR